MAEEQRYQEGHRRCANNCGFFGSPATRNLCSECYRDLRLKEGQASPIAVGKPLASSSFISAVAIARAAAQQPRWSPPRRRQRRLFRRNSDDDQIGARRVGRGWDWSGSSVGAGRPTAGLIDTPSGTVVASTIRPPAVTPSPGPTPSLRPTSFTGFDQSHALIVPLVIDGRDPLGVPSVS